MQPVLLSLALLAPPATAAKPDEPTSFMLPAGEEARHAASPTGAPNHKFVPGKGLEIKSADGRFALAMSLRFGFFYSLRHTPHQPDAATQLPRIENNLEIRRFRTVFHGNLFGAHNKYFLQLALAPREIDVRDGVVRGSPVYDAYMQFERLRDLTLRVGQYRVMYTRERNIADVNPLLIDRSLANNEFNVDRDVGLDLRSEDLGGVKKLRYYAGVFLGEGRDANKFTDPGFMYVGRVDVLPFGLFDDYEASDMWRLKKFRLSVSGAYAFIDRAHKDRGVLGTVPADGGTTNYHNTTADLMLKYAGWSLEAGYMWRRGHRTPGGAVDEMGAPVPVAAARNGHGWLIQTALLLPGLRLEPAFRYSGNRGLGTATSMPNRDEIGGGLNYYFYGHNLKLQVDYFRTFNVGQLALGTDLLRIQIQAAL
jgi:phosphate-selective porin OprO/OprP